MKRKRFVMLLAGILVSGLVVSATAVGGPLVGSRAVVKVAFNKKLKTKIVVDGGGRTLYLFRRDTKGKSTCTPKIDAECARLWPPLTSKGAPRAGSGVNASKLGITKRSDGKRQVTYNGHPLYYFRGGSGYAGDAKPGDVKGQGFFGVWFVLSPRGTPIIT